MPNWIDDDGVDHFHDDCIKDRHPCESKSCPVKTDAPTPARLARAQSVIDDAMARLDTDCEQPIEDDTYHLDFTTTGERVLREAIAQFTTAESRAACVGVLEEAAEWLNTSTFTHDEIPGVGAAIAVLRAKAAALAKGE